MISPIPSTPQNHYEPLIAAAPATSIDVQLENARKQLLDLGLRNTLLNYRPLRSRGVAVVDELSAEVFRILVSNKKPMSFLPAPQKALETDTEREIAATPTGTTDPHPALTQPDEDDSQPAARHLDSRLQSAVPADQLQLRLLNTYHAARTSIEEQGVNILYLALGMLLWFESDSSSIPRRAPLILVPVSLEREYRRAFPCRLY